MQQYVYISLSGENKIAVFTMEDSGRLTNRKEVELPDGPGPMAVSPDKTVLYAALRSSKEVLSLRIDPDSGSLSPAGSVTLNEGPAMISTDRKGRFLMGAYYGAGAISVHAIGADGVVGEQVQWLDTAPRAHYIETDVGNKFVLVPHVLPGNTVFQLHFDEEMGQLTPNEPHVQPPEGEGPRHFCYHPNQRFVYTANEDSSTVTAYRFDNEQGTLESFQNVSTLPPEGYVPGEEANSCAQIRITPDGRFLYAPNRGHNSAACFRVDEEGGLSTIGYTPIERHTRGTAIDPTGQFYYTTGVKSGRLASFSISQQTGALEPLENFALGESPMWVEIV
ncbi:MAG: beta-propeller fold lactonase family protein [Candidatus Latescibacteria bacterium]|nr:beta-propeller fold lactonase family protein [Candidatus Latescibacterota bacterium]